MSDMQEKVEEKEMTEVKVDEPKAEGEKNDKDAKAEGDAPAEGKTEEKPKKEKVPKVKKPYEPPCDLIDRDPTHMNDHVRVTFHDIFGEPDSTIHSFDRVWGLSYTVRSYGATVCITSLLCAIPLSILFGLWFACLSFSNIWCWMPCLKGMGIKLLCARRVWFAMLDTFVAPCYEAMGKVFSNIRITMNKGN